MPPGDLEKALNGLTFPTDNNVMVGLDHADDAGVYKISDSLAIIQTVDFFTPVVDDPYHFGQIAAANALSDVYAMGGQPKTVMNLVAFPVKDLDISILRTILEGGMDKIREAGAVVMGGHSIEDKELKYGLSVTGFIHPDRILTKKSIQPGDHLILTKPLGVGIINTAIKGGVASAACRASATALMATLNKAAAVVMERYPVHACTDITGFGLIGHLAEMVIGTGCGASIDLEALPVIPEAYAFAQIGMVPAGAHKNREFRECMVVAPPSLDPVIRDILYDPQTSGGLLMAVPAAAAAELLAESKEKVGAHVADIGRITKEAPGKITLQHSANPSQEQ